MMMMINYCSNNLLWLQEINILLWPELDVMTTYDLQDQKAVQKESRLSSAWNCSFWLHAWTLSS